jgi:hypothetical protein
MRWRFWVHQFLSEKSLLSAGAAAVGLVGWLTTHHPAFGWLMLGGGGAWTALMYYLLGHADGDASMTPNRAAAVREIEAALGQFSIPRSNGQRIQWQQRAAQLRRIAELERLIMTELPKTSSGIGLLSPEQQFEVNEFVEKAIELSRRRGLLIRALRANPKEQIDADLRDLIGRRKLVSERVGQDLDDLLALKREQAQRIERWRDDLHLTEINLDQIETFLRAVAYDQAVTPSNVSERIDRLKNRVQARMESLQELEQRIDRAVG